jgi:hypothetical protein
MRQIVKRELMIWRFGVGLLGGWTMIAMMLAIVAGGYVCAGFASVCHEKSHLEFGTVMSAMAFLLIVFSLTLLVKGLHAHPLARLAPGARTLAMSCLRRLAVISAIALLPAAVLRALVWEKSGTDSSLPLVLHDLQFGYVESAALYLLHVAALMAITFGPLKVPARVAGMTIYFGAMVWSRQGWSSAPAISCVVFVTIFWLWRRFETQLSLSPPPRRHASGAANPAANGLMQWWEARYLQRAARATHARSARDRIIALLATYPVTPITVFTTLIATLCLAIQPGFIYGIALSWLMAFPVAVLLAMPPAMPLARVMLLPLGAERARMGDIVAAVWARQIRTRLLICAVLGLSLHAFFWWIEWPAFIRFSFVQNIDPVTHLLWSPLAQAVGLYGIALGVCWLTTASPRLLERPGLTVMPYVSLVGLIALGLALKWVLSEAIPATAAWGMGHITFAIVNGLLLPVIAWAIHRSLRQRWANANLAALSAAMHAWSQRVQKAHAVD